MDSTTQTHPTFLTLFDVLQGMSLGRGPAVSRGGKPATNNLKPKPFPVNIQGVYLASPRELLSVKVPVLRIRGGEMEGYQRPLKVHRARAVARWIEANKSGNRYQKMLPHPEITVTPAGDAFYTDGQTRGAGAIIALAPIRVVITKRTDEEARTLFALQGRAERPSRNLMIFDSDGPFEEYIQDAVTSDDHHAWKDLISASQVGASKNRISATAAYSMLRIYVAGKVRQPSKEVGQISDYSEFDKAAADQLAVFLSTFGSRITNPLAFSSIGLRAIALCARAVFRTDDHDHDGDDVNRWIRHMARFEFAKYAHLRSAPELANHMIKFWNRRLPDSRKASLIP